MTDKGPGQDLDAVGFANSALAQSADFRLLDSSPYKNAATDGKDVGADMDALLLATECVESGSCDPAPVDGGLDGGLDAAQEVEADQGADEMTVGDEDAGTDAGEKNGCSCGSKSRSAASLPWLFLFLLFARFRKAGSGLRG